MTRAAAGLAAALSGALAAALAAHHPLSPALALAGVTVAAAAAAARPASWPLWLLPLLPLVGFMPWTGWLVVEELDLLLLAVAAGGYARWALAAPASGRDSGRRRLPMAWLWLVPLALSTAVAAWRGVADAGGLHWGWWQGYHEPLNSLRLLKPIAGVLLLLPLWRGSLRHEPAAATAALSAGMVGALATVALGVWWERWAYTGLLDFSSDYRATGLFWEMHVGGAALDAALALAVPFAVVAAGRVRGRWAAAAVLGVLGLAAYAALATFSRVVYVGLPLAVGTAWWLARRSGLQPGAGALPGTHSAPRAALGWAAVTLLLAAWLFPAGGYRALLALLGAVAVVLAAADATRPLPARAWGVGLAGGLVAAMVVWAMTRWVPKGAYVAYAGAWFSTAALLWAAHRRRGPAGAGLLVGLLAVLAALVAVPAHWGGARAWVPGAGAAMVLALVLVVAAARAGPLWPASWRWRGQTLALLMLLAGVVGVFSGGAYMGQRFAGTADDGSGRQQHWQRALGWLSGGDWALGKGLGRFASNYSLSGRKEDQVGDYRLGREQGGRGQVLILTGGKHQLGWGELFRIGQRIPEPAPGPLRASLRIKAEAPTIVQLEVCEKQLLYVGRCRVLMKDVPQPGQGWQPMDFELDGDNVSRGAWFAPRWIVFSMALGTPGRRVEIDGVQLRDSRDRNLLANGDFDAGLARWFSSSDKHHMPWHAKNLAVHLLFEQGLLGLLAAALAGGVALWRTSFGAARAHPLAPALAGALVGLGVVGLGDSLLDMPRIAWWALWLVAVALSLPGGAHRAGRT